MLIKATVLEKIIKNSLRVLKCEFFKNDVKNSLQYHSGGDDYNPPLNTRAMGAFFGENPANSVIWAYQDDVERKAAAGEKRLYAVNLSGEVVAELWLKNTGEIKIATSQNVDIIAANECYISAPTVNISATQTNLGIGGKAIARVGDTVTVGGVEGTITSGGNNTSV